MSHERSEDAQASLAALAARAAGGDRAAFESIHGRLDGAVHRFFAQRSRDPDLGEELAQRTWAGVWEACAAGRYDPARSAMSTFVYAVASKVWLQHLRSTNSRTTTGDADVLAELGLGDDGGDARLGEALETIRKALDGRLSDLTEQERWVLRAAIDVETDRAVARRLGISPSTAHEAKQSAFGKLRRLLARLGVSGDPAERPQRPRE